MNYIVKCYTFFFPLIALISPCHARLVLSFGVSYPFLTLKIVTTQKLYLKTDVTQLALSINRVHFSTSKLQAREAVFLQLCWRSNYLSLNIKSS